MFIAKLTGIALATTMLVSTAQADTIRIALAEPPSDEMAAFFLALDRAKAAGVDYEWTAFAEEELAIQAVLSGDMLIEVDDVAVIVGQDLNFDVTRANNSLLQENPWIAKSALRLTHCLL